MGKKTIIQPIGPLYGEAINGSVFGRPNGSIFIPMENKISGNLADVFKYVGNYSSWSGAIVFANSGGVKSGLLSYSAQSQDPSNYVQIQISENSDFSTIDSYINSAVGVFNSTFGAIGSDLTIVAGSTYYVRVVLMSGISATEIAVSDTFTVTGVTIA